MLIPVEVETMVDEKIRFDSKSNRIYAEREVDVDTLKRTVIALEKRVSILNEQLESYKSILKKVERGLSK